MKLAEKIAQERYRRQQAKRLERDPDLGLSHQNRKRMKRKADEQMQRELRRLEELLK